MRCMPSAGDEKRWCGLSGEPETRSQVRAVVDAFPLVLEVSLQFAVNAELSILAMWALLSILSCTCVLSARGNGVKWYVYWSIRDVGHLCSPVFGRTDVQ